MKSSKHKISWLYVLLLIASWSAWSKEYVICDQYCGVVDEHGKPRFARIFDQLKPFVGDFALFKNEGQPWGLIDRAGQTRYEFPTVEEGQAPKAWYEPQAWFAGTWLRVNSNNQNFALHAPSGEVLLSAVLPVRRANDWSKEGSLPYVYKTLQGAGREYYEIYNLQGQLRLTLDSRPEYTDHTIMPAQDHATGLWGYVNRDLNWIIPPQYTLACKLIDGSAAVKSGERWNLINSQNERLNTFAFLDQDQDSNPCANFEKASFGVRSLEYQRYYVQYRDGRAIQLPLGTKLSSYGHDSPYLIEVYQESQGVTRGVVRTDGRWVIPLGKRDFAIIGPNAIVLKGSNGLDGLLDSHGKIIAEAQYQNIWPLGKNSDLFIVTKNHLNGVLSRNSGLVIPVQYDRIVLARPGMLLAQNPKTSRYQLFTAKGKELEFPPIEYLKGTLPDGIQRFKLLDGREGFVNAAGQFVAEPEVEPALANATEYDELGLAAVGDTLLNKRGNKIATFSSVWPQYRYETDDLSYGHQFELDPCLIEHPVAYSQGQGDRIPTWCPQASLRAAVKKTMTEFHLSMTLQNAARLAKQKQQYRAELAAPSADVIAISQRWQKRINNIPKEPAQRPIKRLAGSVPAMLQQRLQHLLPSDEAIDWSEPTPFDEWYWVDLNRDGRKEVIFSTPIDGGRGQQLYIFARTSSATWELIAQPYSFDDQILVRAKQGLWPEMATLFLSSQGEGGSRLWHYRHGKYDLVRRCSVYLYESGDMLNFCVKSAETR
ncbi:WG repeat-containing protein [Chitinibacter fontanus]|uniref:WG repeat-containing protein n=1 Tax=Chitinibacter fontanus TaxID=1737446 RepID=A0A7D5V6S3_9NEIS|nr:WG repeat-containing protein [Chitinibacter fontanus]QLI80157.1 WG repeat-containing protein [Chitinibacter fontanus]